MEKYETIDKIVKELHKINFGAEDGIIKIGDDHDLSNCDIEIRKPNDYEPEIKEFMHIKKIEDYCKKCEAIRCNIQKYDKAGKEIKDSNFKLCNISHGTHTFDFLKACGLDPEKVIEDVKWTDIPVLFLMENPSFDYDIYDYINKNKDTDEKDTNGKRPAKKWYWIHSDWSDDYKKGKFNKDEYLRQKCYGRMVFALINQYKLANAYMTNAVKCGMSDAKYDASKENKNYVNETKALNLGHYEEKCIETCFDTFLKEEINALLGNKDELIIFAFGSRTYWYIGDFMAGEASNELRRKIKNCKIILMPHPADRTKNDFRKYILKGKMDEALNKAKQKE